MSSPKAPAPPTPALDPEGLNAGRQQNLEPVDDVPVGAERCSTGGVALAHLAAVLGLGGMIALVTLESPVQGPDVVLIVFFAALMLVVAGEYAVWHTDAVHKARLWAMSTQTGTAMFVVALVGRETAAQQEQRYQAMHIAEIAEPSGPGAGAAGPRLVRDLEFEAQAEELGNALAQAALFAIITCFYGADVAPEVRDVNAGVAATIATVECLAMVAWIVAARFTLLFREPIDKTLVSALGIVVCALVLASTPLDVLAFGVAWPLSALLAIGVRYWVVYASSKGSSMGPPAREMVGLILLAAELWVWGLVIGVSGYTVFNAGLFVGPAIGLAFFAYEFLLGVGMIWRAAERQYGAGSRQSKEQEEFASALAVVVPWLVFRLLVMGFALACALTAGNTPAAVAWLLWPFVVADIVCTFWVAFRAPSQPQFAAVVCVSSLVFGAAVCAPPVAATASLAAPLVLLAAWAAAALGVFVPPLVKLAAPAPPAPQQQQNNRKVSLVVLSSELAVALSAGLAGFALTIAPGRAVLPPSVSPVAFSALIIFCVAHGFLGLVAIWVALDGLRRPRVEHHTKKQN